MEPSVFIITHKKIDYATAARFQEDLLAAVGDGSGSVVIDFGGVETISSIGLRALVVAAKQTRAGNGRIAVAALTPIVREVFLISRFDAILPMYDTVESAQTALAA